MFDCSGVKLPSPSSPPNKEITEAETFLKSYGYPGAVQHNTASLAKGKSSQTNPPATKSWLSKLW